MKRTPFWMASFSYFISVIIGLSAEKKMAWMNATWIITSMQNVKSFWDWTDKQSVRNAVCQNKITAINFGVNHTIPSFIHVGSPKDAATFGFASQVPEKTNISWQSLEFAAALTRTEMAVASIEIILPRSEWDFAEFAIANNFATLTIHAGPPIQVQGDRSGVSQARPLHLFYGFVL